MPTVDLRNSRIGHGAPGEGQPSLTLDEVSVAGLMRVVVETFERARVTYCVLRDADCLDRPGGEVDLLVDRRDFRRLDAVLGPLGFVRLRAWGYAPHRFYLAYDRVSDAWLKLDAVSGLAYGQRPVLGLSLTDRCLQNRRYQRPVWVPSPEDELVALLLHCAVDKRRIDPSRRDRCKVLGRQITDATYLSTLLSAYWAPTMTPPRLIRAIEADDWSALLREFPAVASRHLSPGLHAAFGRIRRKVLRGLGRRVPGFRAGAVTVALLAPDGGGKSTLASNLRRSFRVPVHSMYMGLYSKDLPDRMWRRLPGFGFLSRLIRQWTRYLVAGYHRAYGRIVIFDRYSYDARLALQAKRSWLRHWRQWWLARACPAPDLVVVLDAPGEVLYQRKHEHSVAKLERQRQSYLTLHADLANSVVVDASRDADEVRREVTALVWNAYVSRSRGCENRGWQHVASGPQ